MIRKVKSSDAEAIVNIYNKYIEKTTVSFETEALTVEQMRQRIADISSKYPYYVYENDGNVQGYAYVHQWKERAAYSKTLETTIYLDKDIKHQGVGTALMLHVIEDCKREGFRVLIACITGENSESIEFHKKLGFKQASMFHGVGHKFGRQLDVVDMELHIQSEN